jgi:hypothetical protein
MVAVPSTYAEVETFITMLQAACEDASMNGTLQELLFQPDQTRRAIVHKLLEHMRENRAPKDFVDAFVCLLDDDVAEKAYQVIYKCSRRGI